MEVEGPTPVGGGTAVKVEEGPAAGAGAIVLCPAFCRFVVGSSVVAPEVSTKSAGRERFVVLGCSFMVEEPSTISSVYMLTIDIYRRDHVNRRQKHMKG